MGWWAFGWPWAATEASRPWNANVPCHANFGIADHRGTKRMRMRRTTNLRGGVHDDVLYVGLGRVCRAWWRLLKKC